MRRPDGKSKGAAFVKYAASAAADGAVRALNGFLQVPGSSRALVVRQASGMPA
jgi:hypothetical protein